MYSVDRRDGSDAELIAGVVEHEYFKFRVQKDVETHLRTYLSARTKAIGAGLTVLLTGLGAFGFQQYSSFSAVVRDVQTKSATLNAEIRKAEQLTEQAHGAVRSAEPLLALARENVKSSQAITDGAGAAARQTSDLARAVLDQVRTTQADVQARSRLFQTSVADASEKITLLNEAQRKAQDATKNLAEIQEAASAVRQHLGQVQEAAKRIDITSQSLDSNLQFERQLMIAKTFEIVLLRDGRAVEITLPDFRSQKASPFTLLVEATRIKDDVNFRITVNGRQPAHAFDHFKQGQFADVPGTPFSVRVDSIYHAKLAYDFVLLRVKPADGSGSAAPPLVAAAPGQQD
jgi:hypothetical protein